LYLGAGGEARSGGKEVQPVFGVLPCFLEAEGPRDLKDPKDLWDAEVGESGMSAKKKMVRIPWILLCVLGGSVVKWGVFAVRGRIFGL